MAEPGTRRPARDAAQLFAAFVFLSWCVSVRLPAETPLRNWLLPSPDLVVLLALLTLFAPRPGWQPARGLLRLIAGALLGLRVGRIADGICLRFLDRPFHPVSDLALVPELARLLLSTQGPLRLAMWLALGLPALYLLWRLLIAALGAAARVLSFARAGDAYLALAFVLAACSLALLPALGVTRASPFASAVSPRVVRELGRWLTARGLYDDPAHAAQRRVFADRIRSRQERLRKTPASLVKLAGADVHILLVEAYGRTVEATPAYSAQLAPAYRELAQKLERAGFSVCTDYVRATVFGGNSWMTHATLQSAVPVTDQFEYAMLLEQPQLWTLAKAFRAAGYRAVSVKPGTTRASPLVRLYGFDREYAAWNFGYRGPSYAWSPMPDQFVLQQIEERELRGARQPLFIEYALVSSHYPFTPHPPYVDDWAALGDGSIFARLKPVQTLRGEAGINVSAMGYLDSLSYDLRVLGEFVTRYVRGDALLLILGDHQPIAPVAGLDLARATPLHVLSRRDALLEPFRARGCVPGLKSRRPEPYRTMEDLALDLLSDFSGPAVPGAGP
jgi:hypothetical protein